MSEQDALVGTIIAERYRIDEKLGEGGMGAVYRCEHVLMKKTLAMKVLHSEMTAMDEAVKRFEREAVAAARIDHPNVASATDFGRLENGSFYLVLEYVQGETLSDALRSGPLPVERAVSIASQVAGALSAAHTQGIVHRDLKPDNVMLLERSDGNVRVKVLDFGIAKLRTGDGSKLTEMGRVFGTPQYMSPEQAAGNEVDHRSDLYGLGLILHEMLSGRPTFDSDQLLTLLMMQMTEEPPSLPDHVPEPLRKLVSSLLSKAPDERPPSAEEVAKELKQIGDHANERARVVVGASPVASPPLAEITSRYTGLARRAAHTSVAALKTGVDKLVPEVRRLVQASHRLRVKGIPSWVFGAGGLMLLMVVWFAFGGKDAAVSPKGPGHAPQVKEQAKATPDEGDEDDSRAKQRAALDPELRRMVALAERGSEPAVFGLEQRDEDDRSVDEWLALAIGNLRLRRIDKALDAAERAIDLDPELAGHRTLLGGLRYFAGRDETSEKVLEFAAEHLGSHGADLLFHVWSSTSQKTAATEKAKELLDDGDVRDNMSQALKLALEIRQAKSCEDRKKLMPRLEKFGDERSMIPMREMAKTRGCGPSKKDDCYPCLREDSVFKDALTQVAMRNAPRYKWRR